MSLDEECYIEPPENCEVLRTGRWWILECTERGIAVQGESMGEASHKLRLRREQYDKRMNRQGKSVYEPVEIDEYRRMPTEEENTETIKSLQR